MPGKKILIVDDDVELVLGLGVVLKANGYRTLSAVNAISAINVTRQERPNLIILDIGLPEFNGFAVMEELRREAFLMPIIVLTAREPELAEKQALELGATAYFQKPVDMKLLLAAIEKALKTN